MASPSTHQAQALRIDPQEFQDHLTAGDPVTILDVRNPKAWSSSDQKIRGAIRVLSDHVRIDPSWPKDQLTVIY